MPKALSTLGVGNKVEVPVKSAWQSRFGAQLVFEVADKNHAGYPANSVTLIADKIIALLCSDAVEPANSDANRKNYGNNRHIHSNLLAWLNSNANAGAWYAAKHSADAPPTKAASAGYNGYDTFAGFLAMLEDNFVAALQQTTLTVVKNTVTDGGGYETLTAKMFLASTTEVGLANENNIAEGSKLALFSSDASRLAYPTAQAVSNSDYTSASFNTGAPWYWWLRTPYVSYSYIVRYVSTSGAVNYYDAYNGYWGVRPLCNLLSEILVSDTVNSRGNYEIIWNRPPTTPSGISVPASAYSKRDISISWGASSDPDGDAISYKLERSFNNGGYTQVASTAGLTFTENVSTAWNTLQYRVKAVDSFGNGSAYITSSACAVIHNQPPEISGVNGDLGVKTKDFTFGYSITDPDGDVVTAREAVNGGTIKTHSPMLGAQNTMSVAGTNFIKLKNGQHNLTVTAADTTGGTATRTMSFTKQVNGFTIVLDPPLPATTTPKRINVIVARSIPIGAKFLVEVCNNANDATPTWEDVTAAVIASHAHVFENTTITAIAAAVNIRVTVARGSAIGECWVSGIGGNFECQ